MLEFECIQVFENTWVNDLPEWLSIPEFLSKLGAVTARARGLNLIILISTNNESSFIIYVLSRQKDGNLLHYHSNSLNLYTKLLLQGCIQDRSTVIFLQPISVRNSALPHCNYYSVFTNGNAINVQHTTKWQTAKHRLALHC